MAVAAVEIDVDVALDTWARWSRRVLGELGWPPVNIIARIVRYGLLGAAQQSGIRLTEVDELSELVERSVMRLEPRNREVVMRHYLLPEPDYISAAEMSMDPRRFSERLNKAKDSIRDYLSGAVESRRIVA
jgi:hypothetical protein